LIYLVSGFDRSGTSMMMRCLITGGLVGVHDHFQDMSNMIPDDPNYHPNPNGFYGLRITEFNRPDFVEEYNGKLIKCPWRNLRKLPRHDYNIVFMLRDPYEIRTSMNKFIPTGWKSDRAYTYIYDWLVPAILEKLRSRGDMMIQTILYADVVSSPQKEFDKLQLPINSSKAAFMVQPELYRFRVGYD